MTDGRYLTAAICANGHVATDAIEFHDNPGKFCQHCGASIIVACPHCQAAIQTAIEDVAAGGPRAEAGAARSKRMVGKAGTAVGQAASARRAF